jgi:hypothetical protein
MEPKSYFNLYFYAGWIWMVGQLIEPLAICQAAVDLQSYATRVEISNPPTVLYRWVHPHHLSQTEFLSGGTVTQLPEINSSEYVQSVRDLLRLFKNRVAFSWIDPVLGSHGVVHEHYGGREAILLVFEVQPHAKAVRFIHESHDRQPLRQSIRNADSIQTLRNSDLIEHITPELHEWIIVNPRAIRAYSFDPRVTFLHWRKFFRPFLVDPHYRPPLDRIHFRSHGEKTPIWGNSKWSQSVFFGDQFFAFNLTPGHPWFGKVERIESWNLPSIVDLKAFFNQSRSMGIDCSELMTPEFSPSQAYSWWEALRVR